MADLIVENGTNNGDALITLAYFLDYCANKGYDVDDSADDDTLNAAIRRGSLYISTYSRYQGFKKGGRLQLMAFPRTGMIDEDGYGIDGLTVPREAQMATAEASYYEYQNPNALNPQVDLTARVKSETIGPISTTYDLPSTGATGSRPILTILGDILRPLMGSKTSNRLVGRAERGG